MDIVTNRLAIYIDQTYCSSCSVLNGGDLLDVLQGKVVPLQQEPEQQHENTPLPAVPYANVVPCALASSEWELSEGNTTKVCTKQGCWNQQRCEAPVMISSDKPGCNDRTNENYLLENSEWRWVE